MENFSIKGLNRGQVFILDAEETELLHVNYTFSKIYNDMLVQFRFDGVRPIVGTDMYDVGTCRIDGKQGTILCAKENIIAAQSSTMEPLIEVAGRSQRSEGLSPINAEMTAISAVDAVAPRVRIGAFSSYVFE